MDNNFFQKNYPRKIALKMMTPIIRRKTYYALVKSKKLNQYSELLGCTVKEFRQHIEEQFEDNMTWENQGEWTIDHIKPIYSFDLSKKKEFFEASHYTNCQPLWMIDNCKKGYK